MPRRDALTRRGWLRLRSQHQSRSSHRLVTALTRERILTHRPRKAWSCCAKIPSPEREDPDVEPISAPEGAYIDAVSLPCSLGAGDTLFGAGVTSGEISLGGVFVRKTVEFGVVECEPKTESEAWR